MNTANKTLFSIPGKTLTSRKISQLKKNVALINIDSDQEKCSMAQGSSIFLSNFVNGLMDKNLKNYEKVKF